jgi:hypothetical protein
MRLGPFFLVPLSACASLDPVACRHANWYDLGARTMSTPSNASRTGIEVDAARYAQGWREGKYEADSRKNESTD